MAVLHTTSSAARECDVPESYVRQLIARKVITPPRDMGGRAILSAKHLQTIREVRARGRRAPLDAA